jgi:hypothetical protein
MFRPRLRPTQPTDVIKVLVLDCRVPAFQRLIRFLGDDVLHHLLPRPRCQFGIATIQTLPRQRRNELRLNLRFVLCLEDALRLKLVACFETPLFAGDFVFEVENAPRTSEQTECLFH